ncbi:MAG: KamA family radical SAM protein [Spirochaetes bacterium]|nr:KamA family radical SAM protein [Spirochaetota bacterium]
MVGIRVPLRKFTHWSLEYRRRIQTRKRLERRIALSPSESNYFKRLEQEGMQESAGRMGGVVPVSITTYYLNLVGSEPTDPLRLQCIPREEEWEAGPLETADPLSDQTFSPVPRLVHRYRDRVLLLVTDQCAMNCRFCFRRHFVGKNQGAIRQSELDHVIQYLKEHLEVKELLLSGGDPLTLSDEKLFALVDTIRFSRPGIVLRVSSRMPVVLPSRITRRFAYQMRNRQPFWFVLHVNHPRELTQEAEQALKRLADAGVPLLSQTVLLRGVNDEVGVLEELFRSLTARRIKPYYLFQMDLAQGTSHFRVPLDRGMSLMRELKNRLSALSLPTYALDLPNGGGKVSLIDPPRMIEGEREWIFHTPEGREYRYPKE